MDQTKPKLSPRDFFLQLGVMATLYVFAIGFLVFIFNLVDSAFPVYQAYAGSYDPYSSGMRAAISSIIVSFPLFLWLLRIYGNILKSEPEKKELGMRKWIIYFTLFVTGVAIAIDFIVLINRFLGGADFTTAFILKVLAIILVAGAIFYACLRDIKGYWDVNPKSANIFMYVVSTVVALSLVGGFIVIGSPATARKLGYDNTRIYSLQDIQSQIVYFYQRKALLPQTLNEIVDPISGVQIPKDPVTGQAFEYSIKGDLSFELCATFDLPSQGSQNVIAPGMKDVGVDSNWKHEAGHTCFTRNIDKELYPINKTIR